MKIRNREIGNDQPTYIIAEAGTNHMGSLTKVRRLCEAARDAGTDAIKFQAFVKDEPLFCPYDGDETRIPYWNKTVLTVDEWAMVSRACHRIGMDFILSIFQEAALPFLDHCDAAKVASRAATTFPYDKTDLPLIVSDGMIDSDELTEIVQRLKGRDLCWLACESEYPTPLKEAMENAFSAAWTSDVGLSDHSGTPWPAMAALVGNVPIIEVHFSLDKQGRDAPVELTPDELKMVCDFRNALALAE